MVRFKVFSLGCKLNHYEAEFLREEFLRRGCGESDDADIYIVNTCALTSAAERKTLKLIRRLKREHPQAEIVATGCMAEVSPGRLRRVAGLIVSHFDKAVLAGRVLGEALPEQRSVWDIHIEDFPQKRAFLKIQDGCDKHCTFCISRRGRGRSTSRPFAAIKSELERLIDKGFYEIVLVGLDLAAWQEGGKTFAGLLEELSRTKGLGRIRLSSLHPKEVGDDLLEIVCENDKICPHLHLSFQSGDSGVLHDMARGISGEDCLRLAEKIRRQNPYLGISCDIMFGFPSETDKAFENTLKLLEVLVPVKVHAFRFSPRPFTAAASFKRCAGEKELKERQRKLSVLSRRLSRQFRFLCRQKVWQAVFDKQKNGFWEGYTDNYIRVKTAAEDLPASEAVKVKITRVTEYDSWCEAV